jgi:hypothetical protein
MTTTKTRKAARASKAIVSEGPGAPWKRKAVKGASELATETGGAAFVEYITLICVVILGGSAAVVSLGVPLVHMYRVAQLIVGLPIP